MTITNIDKRKPLFGIWIQSPSKDVAQVIRKTSHLNWVAIDMQHGYWTLSEVEEFTSKCGIYSESRIIPFVRTGLNPGAANINEVLDAGAWGIIVPCVDNTEKVVQIKKWSLFPPHGIRSVSRCFGLLNTGLQFEQYLEWSRQNIKIISMIETEEGLNNIDQIARLSDGVMFGIKDLSLCLSMNSQRTLELVLEIIKGKIQVFNFGFVGIPDHEVEYIEPFYRSLGTIRDLLEDSITAKFKKHN